ncbi:MAG: Kelch repeat-containing protein [Candidatus Sericytochromatia bacterium]
MRTTLVFALAIALAGCQPLPIMPAVQEAEPPSPSAPAGQAPVPTAPAAPGPDEDAPAPRPAEPVGSGGSGVEGLAPPSVAVAIESHPAGTWQPGPSLHRPRAGLVSGLANGRLLALEGDGRASMEVLEDGVWRYDGSHDLARVPAPATGSPGLYLGAGAVDGEKVFIVGGTRGGAPSAGINSYDETGLRISVSPIFPVGVEAPAAGAFGTVLVMAGGGARPADAVSPRAVGDVVRFDTASGQMGAMAAMPQAVMAAASVVLGGRLYVFGGYDPDGAAVDAVQVLDYATGTWQLAAPLPLALGGAAAAVLDGKVYMAGGRDAAGALSPALHRYDPVADAWEALPGLPTPRALLALSAYEGRLWAIGGVDATLQPTTAVEVFRP